MKTYVYVTHVHLWTLRHSTDHVVAVIITNADNSRGVKRSSASVCVAVCCITQKRMIPKCSNLVWGMTLGYRTSGTALGLKGQWSRSQGHKVQKHNKMIEWPVWVMHSIECPASSNSYYAIIIFIISSWTENSASEAHSSSGVKTATGPMIHQRTTVIPERSLHSPNYHHSHNWLCHR